MDIQINTDETIEDSEALARKVEAEIATVLDRFSDQIGRVEVHLSDRNSARDGVDDMRCVMEVRPPGMDPVAVTHDADSVESAYSGAVRKLQRLLETSLGKLGDRKGGPTRTLNG